MILKKFFEEMTFLGGILFYILLFLFFLFTKNYNLFLTLFLGSILIYFFTFIIRIFYYKQRPKKINYSNFLEKIDSSSFPSIHAARTTFILLSLIIFIFHSFFIWILLFFISLIVLYSRIYLKKHYFIDVIAGVLLGSLCFIISILIW